MLKKRFSTTLLALVVAVAIPGSVFAADVASESTGEVSAPTSVAAEAVTPVITDGQQPPAAEPPTEEAVTPDIPVVEPPAVEPTPVEPPAVEPTPVEPPAVEPMPVEPPAVEPTPVELPAVEPTPVDQSVVETPPTEEVIAPETPAVEPEVIPEVLPPVVEEVVTAPAIVLEEVVTAPAIVVEPVAATLTITHRLIVGDEYDDMDQTFDGFEVGQTVDLADYVVNAENVVCISNLSELTLDEENDTIVLEYDFIDTPNVDDNREK